MKLIPEIGKTETTVFHSLCDYWRLGNFPYIQV